MEKIIEKKAKECFGNDIVLKDLKRLLGGAQKYTYLANLDNGFKFVVYVWDKSTNYFSDSKKNIFLSSSPAMFQSNNKLMRSHGIKTPEIYYIDKSLKEPVYAFAEYIDGVDLDYIIENQKSRLVNVLKSLKENLNILHNINSQKAGQINNLLKKDFDCIKYCNDEALNNIEYLIKIDPDSEDLYLKLKILLQSLQKDIEKRNNYTFIHSELGPNHVMVDKDDNSFMIDIEGARFFDLEYEESFLKIRFGSNYELLKSSNLDENRMKYYHICHVLGNLSGAYELLNKNYYDTKDLLGMITFFKKDIQQLCS